MSFFLSHFQDFSAALHLHTHTGKSVTKHQFSRAAAICLSPLKQDSNCMDKVTLSNHMVDIVFMMFDTGGDNKLSHEEFLAVLRDWKYKGGRVRAGTNGTGGFWRCVQRNVIK